MPPRPTRSPDSDDSTRSDTATRGSTPRAKSSTVPASTNSAPSAAAIALASDIESESV